MDENKQTTEDQILKAAEEVFLKKGFKNAKTSDIAELAGVNNALINYYFRSKENLFNKVLRSKIELLATSIISAVNQDLPFLEMMKGLIETQFDFFNANELLPRFILSEILPNEARADMFRNNIVPIILKAGVQLNQRLQEEIEAGRIRDINMFDLLYAMTSMNALCFVVKPLVIGGEGNPTMIPFSQIMEGRKSKNVEIIMSYLKNTPKP